MSNQPFNNDTDQQTRQQVLKDTYLSRAQADADLAAGGRFKKQVETHITGTPSYPQQPSSSPWAKSLDEVSGPEGPFDIDIEFVGELGGASSAPVVVTVETASATSDGGSAPPKGRGGPLPASARSFRRRVW